MDRQHGGEAGRGTEERKEGSLLVLSSLMEDTWRWVQAVRQVPRCRVRAPVRLRLATRGEVPEAGACSAQWEEWGEA